MFFEDVYIGIIQKKSIHLQRRFIWVFYFKEKQKN
jgi:hypothetical protein